MPKSWEDPFLRDHQVGPHQYELSAGMTPVSVRDQMFRGMEIVARLVGQGFFPAANGRLLIIGGGVAGASAAILAARKGIEVTLLERDEDLFSRFEKCDTRDIEPTLYDWPADHWRDSKWADSAVLPMPVLPLAAKPASALVSEWRTAVTTEEIALPNLHIHRNTEVTSSPVLQDEEGADDAVVHLPFTSPDDTERFGIVLYTAGMGTEKKWISNSEPVSGLRIGPGFWEKDTFQEKQLGCNPAPKVIIAGSGDGALQDYIRILTGRQPAQVIGAIEDVLKDSLQWRQMQTTLLTAQDTAMRQHVNGLIHLPNEEQAKEFFTSRDVSLLNKLHQTFRNSVDDLFLDHEDSLSAVLGEMVTKDRIPAQLHLLVKGQAFTWCYALNRFLTLLLEYFIRSQEYFVDAVSQGQNATTLSKLAEQTIWYESILEENEDKSGVKILLAGEGISLEDRITLVRNDTLIVNRIGLNRPNVLYTSDRIPRQRHLCPYYPL